MLRRLVFSAVVACSSITAFAQTPADALWKDIDEKPMLAAASRAGNVGARRNIIPQAYRTLQLNRPALERVLRDAPPEFSGPRETFAVEVAVPLPDGGFARFAVQESPVMEPALS